MKRNWWVAVTPLLILAVAFSALAQTTEPAKQPQQQQQAQQGFTKTVAIKAEDNLIVYADPGSIRVTPWDKPDKKEILVKASGLTNAADYGRIQITSKAKDIRVDYRGDRSVPITLDLTVPAGFSLDVYVSDAITVNAPLNGKMKFRNTTGAINMPDMAGKLTIESRDGDVTIGNVDGDAIITGGGDIDVQNVTGTLEMKNQHGDSYARNVGGAVNARTEDGDVSLGELAGNAFIQAGIGDVEVRKVAAMATLTTVGGDIDVFETVSTGMVIASSTSGDITLKKVAGGVDAKTEDGEIMAEMAAGSSGSSKYFSKDGDISVYFAEGAKATVETRVPAPVGGEEKSRAGAQAQAQAATPKTGAAAPKAGGNDTDDEEQVVSDYKVDKTENRGDREVKIYQVNGGGDSVLIEALQGDIAVKKLVPRTPAPKAAPKPVVPTPKKP